jgi:hypothetical protein
MQLFWTILGLLCFLVLLIVAGILLFVSRLRRGLQELSEMGQAGGTPARLHLTPAVSLPWRDAATAEKLRGPLGELGFQPAGLYSGNEIPGLLLDTHAHVEQGAYAVVYEHPQAGVWVDLFSRYVDGTSITYTTTAHGRELDQRPGHGKVCAPELETEALWRRFLAERPQRPLASHTPEGFAAEFESSYAEAMDWRNARGYTEEEVRRTLEAGGNQPSPEEVEQVRQQMNSQAREALDEVLREQFLGYTTIPAAEWEKVRERVVFVHDRIPAEDVEDLLDTWLEIDWREHQKGAPRDPGMPPRSAFAALNHRLPAEHQFRKIGEMDRPLPVDVYAAPFGAEDEE